MIFADSSGIQLDTLEEAYRVVQTAFGRRRVIEDTDGFRYSLCSRLKNGKESWRCSKKATGCKAYIITDNKFIVRKVYEHCHPSALPITLL